MARPGQRRDRTDDAPQERPAQQHLGGLQQARRGMTCGQQVAFARPFPSIRGDQAAHWGRQAPAWSRLRRRRRRAHLCGDDGGARLPRT
eukprot:13171404-Alexandrium_andersonii.AAC.1